MQLLKRCFVCSAGVPPLRSPDDVLQGRFAVDPERGRLWVICGGCRSWNLIPIEARWEAIEDLERLGHDRGRVLAKTANVALLEADGVQIVRVGETLRSEQAWWRYRREAEQRISNARRIIRRGRWKDAGWTLLLFGFPLPGMTAPETWLKRARVQQYRVRLWTGEAVCDGCGGVRQEMEFADPLIAHAGASGLVLQGRCSRCAGAGRSGRFSLSGAGAERALQRVLAYHNFAGPTADQLDAALRAMEAAPDATTFIHQALARPAHLHGLGKTQLISLEVAANESREAALLALEVRELERRWRTEEEIAAIIDNELTPP